MAPSEKFSAWLQEKLAAQMHENFLITRQENVPCRWTEVLPEYAHCKLANSFSCHETAAWHAAFAS
jgi:hypothetical protein